MAGSVGMFFDKEETKPTAFRREGRSERREKSYRERESFVKPPVHVAPVPPMIVRPVLTVVKSEPKPDLPRIRGIVDRWYQERTYGFIVCERGRVFVHQSNVIDATLTMAAGVEVEFSVVNDVKYPDKLTARYVTRAQPESVGASLLKVGMSSEEWRARRAEKRAA